MKNLSFFLLSFSLVLISCTKQFEDSPATTNEKQVQIETQIQGCSLCGGFSFTGFRSSGASIIQNSGVRMTCDVIRNLKGGAYQKVIFIANYYPNGYWVQTGYGTRSPFSIWKDGVEVTGDTALHVLLLMNVAPPLKYGQKQVFGIRNISGTTVWRTFRDDVDLYEFDLGVNYGTNPEVFLEANADKPPQWPMIEFYPAIEILTGTWQAIPDAYVAQVNTGIHGNIQNNNLLPNQIRMGGTLSSFPYGTQLFSQL